MEEGGGGGREGTALSHIHIAERAQSLQNIKIPPAVLSCNIHVDTIIESFYVQSGSERVRPGLGRGLHASPGSYIPGKVAQIFKTVCLASGEPTPSATIRD